MKERQITGKVGVAIRDDARFTNCAMEVKVAKGKTMYASQLKDHQLRALRIAQTGAMYHKISDLGIGEKPFDLFVLKRVHSYVVVWFQIGTRSHEVWAVPIDKVEEGKGITLDYAHGVGIRIMV